MCVDNIHCEPTVLDPIEVIEEYPERWKVVWSVQGRQYYEDDFLCEREAEDWARKENLFNLCERGAVDIFRYTPIKDTCK